MAERLADGTFTVGHRKIGGRKRGALNRFTRLREEFVDVYQNCGGREKLEEMLQENPRVFFGLLVSLMPKLKVHEERSLNVDIKDLSMVELLRLGGVSDNELEGV